MTHPYIANILPGDEDLPTTEQDERKQAFDVGYEHGAAMLLMDLASVDTLTAAIRKAVTEGTLGMFEQGIVQAMHDMNKLVRAMTGMVIETKEME